MTDCSHNSVTLVFRPYYESDESFIVFNSYVAPLVGCWGCGKIDAAPRTWHVGPSLISTHFEVYDFMQRMDSVRESYETKIKQEQDLAERTAEIKRLKQQKEWREHNRRNNRWK